MRVNWHYCTFQGHRIQVLGACRGHFLASLVEGRFPTVAAESDFPVGVPTLLGTQVEVGRQVADH